ncbi:putative zinc-binding metallopeptidase [Oceanicella sp. SM1341]|uniref:zinc-binding metallopeptidase family protein n=1 Tax=Oceanicella sp. SM1341 TaxID=1548889 RepID=UPI000E54F92D|nr:putative zinc-binding metallopeptidase [Oceanicella sp. SM1341]
METFACPSCSGTLYFENLACACGQPVVWDPGARVFRDADQVTGCANRAGIDCNWAAAGSGGLCASCAMTRTRPDLSVRRNAALWAEAEAAKRWVLANLMRWGIFTARDPASPPVFDLLSELVAGGREQVMMGHADGVITINVLEADTALREKRRDQLGEPYRTLTGHFRHELAHYLFLRLEPREGFLPAFRALFGDETADYGAALEAYYASGSPPAGWQESHVSEYARAHPHEDWAETVAHALHLTDMLDSAAAMQLATPRSQVEGDAYDDPADEHTLAAALDLAIAMNHMARSMGLPDLYPFVVSAGVREKLLFVREWLPRVTG